MPREIAIGDVHGCAKALAALIDAIQPQPDDVIIVLGDYIDGGPDSRGVLEQLLALSIRCKLIPLLGNHEEMLFAALEGRSDLDYWLRFGGDRTLESYAAERPAAMPWQHLDFLKSCGRFHETESHIFVHANYWPNLPMAEQPSNALLWEHLQPNQTYRHYSGKTFVVGHTPQKSGDILDLGCVVCIDTNCCEGGWLTALEVNTRQVWQANQAGELRR
jgi:serine/threonine protein phosphatase 1